MQSDDEVQAQNLISPLSKLFEKKRIKSLEKTLTLVLDRLEKIVSSVDTTVDIQQREIIHLIVSLEHLLM